MLLVTLMLTLLLPFAISTPPLSFRHYARLSILRHFRHRFTPYYADYATPPDIADIFFHYWLIRWLITPRRHYAFSRRLFSTALPPFSAADACRRREMPAFIADIAATLASPSFSVFSLTGYFSPPLRRFRH
jgi:hypothetical protein